MKIRTNASRHQIHAAMSLLQLAHRIDGLLEEIDEIRDRISGLCLNEIEMFEVDNGMKKFYNELWRKSITVGSNWNPETALEFAEDKLIDVRDQIRNPHAYTKAA